MSPVRNLAFFRARRGQSEALGAALAPLVEPTLLEAGCLNFVIHPAALTLFILYFPNKTRRICSGSSSYNTGPLLASLKTFRLRIRPHQVRRERNGYAI
jgi:hypothetical protein